MKSTVARGILIAVLQLLIVGSLAAKYKYERETRPRLWVKVQYYDPDLPIRGRYASLQLEVAAPGVFPEKPLVENHLGERPSAVPQKSASQKHRYMTVWDLKPVRLEVRDGQLVAISDPASNVQARYLRDEDGKPHISLAEPVDFFVPENAINLPPRQFPPTVPRDWWAEVTVPKKGPPRPIRLGIKQPDGQIMPLPAN